NNSNTPSNGEPAYLVSIHYYTDSKKSKVKPFHCRVRVDKGRQFLNLIEMFVCSEQKLHHDRGHAKNKGITTGWLQTEKEWLHSYNWKTEDILPTKFPLQLACALLHQRMIEHLFAEKWAYAAFDSSAWLLESCVVTFKQANSQHKRRLEVMVRAVIVFFQLNGFDIVAASVSASEDHALLNATTSSTHASSSSSSSASKTEKMSSDLYLKEGLHWLDSKLERLGIPKMVVTLIPSCAKFLHDVWVEELHTAGWIFGLHHCYQRKEDPWLSPWHQLSLSAKHIRMHEVIITLKTIVMCGFIIRSMENSYGARRKFKFRKL
ncbi:hypothetical protein RFI_19795, partial [Reticulomyxa filosa]